MTAPGASPGEHARRLAQAAWEAARGRSLDPLQQALPETDPLGLADRRLAREMARDAERARRAQIRAQQEHAAAVARRRRRLRRSRRAVPPWAVAGAGAAGAAAVAGEPALLSITAVAAVRVGLALRRLRRPAPAPHPPSLPPAPPPPPHPRSGVFPYVRRLQHVRDALTHLVPLVCPAGREAAAEAWAAAGEADVALRWQAARLAAAEPHRGLDRELVDRLEAGVAAQERLVQAVADLVTASADPVASDRLQDVTDRLLGLAQGLREVR